MTATLFGAGMAAIVAGCFFGFLFYITKPGPFRIGEPPVLLVILGLALLALAIVSGAVV
jgi:hypothetical protein